MGIHSRARPTITSLLVFNSVIRSWNMYKPKHQIWYESAFPCAQDPGISVWFIWEVPDPVNKYSPFSIPTGLWLIEAYLQRYTWLFTFECNHDYYGWTDGHSSNV